MDHEAHLERDRAESFGSVAELYDRYRLGYPPALLDDLAALHPDQVLDVGCGTGKVAGALLQRGLSVLGVEADWRMAEIARGHGVEVDGAPFETWDDAGRRFDLLTCGEAWHWIDPQRGIDKAARVLRPGGTGAWFWTYIGADEPTAAALDQVYLAHAPKLAGEWSLQLSPPEPVSLADSAAFTTAETRVYRWERELTADEWVGRAGTASNHLALGPQRLAALLAQLRATIEARGATVHAYYETVALIAHRR